jgi:hypothetical protein
MSFYHLCRTVGYASHSLETICTAPFKTTCLVKLMLGNNVTNANPNEYKLTAIVLDIADHWLFKAVGIQKDEIDKRSFLKLSFVNKGLEGIHLGNILYNKSIKYQIQPYFKVQSVPIISYAHTIPIATTNI